MPPRKRTLQAPGNGARLIEGLAAKPEHPRMATYQHTEERSIDRPEENLLISMATGSVNYWFSFVSDPLTVLFFLFWEAFVLRSSFLVVGISFASGLMSWTLIEYVFHRWVYHKGRTPAHVGHKKHHESPEALIAMPWFIVTAVFMSVWFVTAYLLQLHFVLGSLAGLLTGFVCYGLFHHVHHHYHFKNRQYRKLRAHHFIHHQYPDTNFGVTSRLWDHVFGTTYRREVKKTSPAGAAGLIAKELR